MTATTFTNPAFSNPALPGFEVRLRFARPDRTVYLRRRLLVGLLFVALVAGIGLSAQTVLADHGGVPASASVVQPAVGVAAAAPIAPPANAPINAPTGTPYLVQPGDTIWSIAQTWHGSASVTDYVEHLVEVNGGASLQAGQLLTLP